jgi:phosphatidylserine/phosphatidylglycerophosphate/cardiolipin synthase-like enzyme
MKQLAVLIGLILLITALPGCTKFEDLQVLPPAPVTPMEAFGELDPSCVDNPVEGAEQGKIIIDNREALRSRWVMIENSNCEILIEYYTVASDRISIAGLALLIEAANRGVKVKILLDGLTHQIKTALAAATVYNPRARQNIEIRLFNPVSLFSPGTWLARLHDKAIIVDGHQIMSGGRNVSNKYFGIEAGGYFDADVYLEGELGKHTRRYFYNLWNGEHVSPFQLTNNDYDTIQHCPQDDFRFDDQCHTGRNSKIPRLIEYMEALKQATEKLEQAKAEHKKIEEAQNQLTREIQALENPTDDELRLFIEQDDLLGERSRKIRDNLAIDVTDTRAVITQEDLDTHKAFVANGPVSVFYDDPAEDKSLYGIAMQLIAFFEKRVKKGAVVTVFSPYVILGRNARGLVDHLINEMDVTLKIYTNSSVSSDNVFAQAFYRHPNSKDFLVKSGVEVYEFKGYRSKEEEEIFNSTGRATTVHMKAALIENPGEDAIIIIGTFNWDLRSAYYNRELVSIIDAKASEHQVRIFRDLARMIETHGYRAGLETHDAAGNMNEWYEEYLKTPPWKRALMKLLRTFNYFTLDWLRKQA